MTRLTLIKVRLKDTTSTTLHENGIRWCTFYFYSVVDYRGVNSQYVVISFPYKNIDVHKIHVSHNNNYDGDDTKVEKVRTVAHKAR